MAEQEVRELLGLLRDELELHRVLLDVSRRKQKVLLGGGLEDLVKITEAEQALILRVAALNSGLERLHASLAERLGVPAAELTLAKLVELVGEPYAGELAGLRASLLRVTQEMSEVNEANGALIRHILAYINFSLDALVKAWASEGVYSPTPDGVRRGRARGAVLVDRQA